MMAAIFLAQNDVRRPLVVRKRLSVTDELSEQMFRRNYRMGFDDFESICEMIKDDEPFQRRQGGSRPLTVEQQVGTTLLLTPILRPRTPEEERYNTSLCKTRVCVERAFGLLKSRFRCLDNTGGILCYPVERTCKIIMTCCVLHNICLQRHIPLPDDVVQLANDPNQPGIGQDAALNNHDGGGVDVRNEIIRTWFTQ